MTVILDPTGEQHPTEVAPAARPSSLDGRAVGLLDIAKPRGDVFLERLAARGRELGWQIHRFTKPTFTKPAPADLRYEISQRCEVVIEALAD